MFATSEAQRKECEIQRKNLDKYAEYKRAFIAKNKDYVEREKKDLKKDTLYKKSIRLS
jgi:hypothetical protein